MNKSKSCTDMDEYFTRLNELRAERMQLDAYSADPEKWQSLSEKYLAIGAYCNAEECKLRAEYYASLQ